MSIVCEKQISTILGKDDLSQMVIFINNCLVCSSENEFNRLLLSFSNFLDFEYVLYAYSVESYQNERDVYIVNLSNPEKWAEEYGRNKLLTHDPVRLEMERLLKTGVKSGFIEWDNYIWQLSNKNQDVINRRKYYGLETGFSYFVDSEKKDFTFLFSFASPKTIFNQKIKVLCTILGPHLTAARKRLVVLGLIATLSEKEKTVASWLLAGKTNGEIADILNVTSNTIKFHVKNIYTKLHVSGRQQAIAILLAERYLSL